MEVVKVRPSTFSHITKSVTHHLVTIIFYSNKKTCAPYARRKYWLINLSIRSDLCQLTVINRQEFVNKKYNGIFWESQDTSTDFSEILKSCECDVGISKIIQSQTFSRVVFLNDITWRYKCGFIRNENVFSI